MHARITLEETALFADPAGALFWPARRTLVVADLHLGKGAAGALRHLQRLTRKYTPGRIACLGDPFAGRRIASADLEFLARLVKGQDWVWVAGSPGPAIPAGIGGTPVAEIVEDKLALRAAPAVAGTLGYGEIVGGLRPVGAVTNAAGRTLAPCFFLDGRRMVMPAFGAPEGGLDVLDPAISRLFGRVRVRALLLGPDRLQLVPGQRLEPVVAGPRRLK